MDLNYNEFKKNVIKQVKFPGKRRPSKQSAEKRGIYGIKVINDILKKTKNDTNYENYIILGFEIVKCLYVYENNLSIPKYSIERILLSLIERIKNNEKLYSEIFREIETRIGKIEHSKASDSNEIIVSFNILKIKKSIDVENCIKNIEYRKKDLPEKFREKVLKIILKEKNNYKINIKNNENDKFKEIEDLKKIKNEYKKHINLEKFTKIDDEERLYLNENYLFLKYNVINYDVLFNRKNEIEKYFDLKYFENEEYWNMTGLEYYKGENNSLEDYFEIYHNKKYNVKFNENNMDLEEFFKVHYENKFNDKSSGKFFNLGKLPYMFISAYFFFLNKEINRSKQILHKIVKTLKDLKKKNFTTEIYLHVYNLISLCNFIDGNYYESIFYLNCAINLGAEYSLKNVADRFLNCKFLVERMGNIQGPTSTIKFINSSAIENFDGEKNIEFIIKNRLINERLLMNIFLRDCKNALREIRLFNSYEPVKNNQGLRAIDNFYKDFLFFLEKYSQYQIISIFCENDLLNVIFYENNNSKCVNINTEINFKEIKNELNLILSKSKETLKKEVKTEDDKNDWWNTRIYLDNKLKQLIFKLNQNIEKFLKIKDTIILILDETTTQFPFEAMNIFKNKSVYRIPSFDFLWDKLDINLVKNIKNVKYLLDPENNLDKTNQRMKRFLNEKRIFDGVESRVPTVKEYFDFISSDLFIYFGHGSSEKYIKKEDISKIKKIKDGCIFLFGCSSAKILCIDNFRRNGFALKFLENASNLLGCLWEVTDKDIDNFSMSFIDNLIENNKHDISRLVNLNRDKFKLKYLNGASVVVYGLPRILIFEK